MGKREREIIESYEPQSTKKKMSLWERAKNIRKLQNQKKQNQEIAKKATIKALKKVTEKYKKNKKKLIELIQELIKKDVLIENEFGLIPTKKDLEGETTRELYELVQQVIKGLEIRAK